MAEEQEPELGAGPISIEPGSSEVLLRGLVPPHGLGALLLQIAERRMTGQLLLHSDMGRRTIYFHSGFPVFGESSLFGERLGALGVRHGLLKRDDVARGLSLAREHGCGLGQALLELDRVNTADLFALLSVQLREVVAASCGPEPLRARFINGHAALRNVVVLRLHPLTAVLTALNAVPAEDRHGLLGALAERRLVSVGLPMLAQQWLSDLGYLGELDRLAAGEPTLSTLRARLIARQRSGIERAFDPAQVQYSLPGPREPGAATASSQSIADLVTLTLLLSGALRLATPAVPQNGSRESTPPLQLALAEAIDQTPFEIRQSEVSPRMTETDAAIELYLWGERDRTLAPQAAVWGPSIEARDPFVPVQVMTLYVTLKPEKRAVIVLDVDNTASPEWISEQYARRLELLGSVESSDASPHLICRASELAQCFDDALEKLLPGSVSRPLSSVPPPPSPVLTAPPASERPPPDARRTSSGYVASPTIPPAAALPRVSAPPPADTSNGGVEALSAKVEGLMRANNWQAVRETLDAQPANNALPFSLRLANAMAQREAQRELEAASSNEHVPQRRTLYAAVGVGIAIGCALSWLVHVFWH